ncbi:MAG: pseudouridine synthase [Bacteroidota bacterium]
MTQLHYYLINKPYEMLSQFTKEADHHRVLGELYDFPPDVYPVGRLDRDSEGLLLLTNDKSLNHRLLDPTSGHERSYWVQVEGIPNDTALKQLRSGVDIRINKKVYSTRKAKARVMDPPAEVQKRNPPIRYRASVPDSWLELTLTEGKNRQVRRMCAAVGFPVLRLIRHRIEGVKLSDLEGCTVRKVEASWLKSKIFG